MEPRYYSQVPFRGCSLMVKPQSSKLITRVRFPSSPPLQRLRRKRRGLFRCWDDGNPFRMRICFLARSESARSSSSSPPQIPLKVAGIRFIAQLPDGSEDATAFHHAQALLARLDAHLGASSFDDVYASSANNETQCREAFRTIFEARVQIQHFEVKTAQGGPT